MLIPICNSQQRDWLCDFLVQCDPENICQLFAQIDLVFHRFPGFRRFVTRKLVKAIRHAQKMGPLLEFAQKFMFFDGFSIFQNDWKGIKKLKTKDVYQGPFKFTSIVI